MPRRGSCDGELAAYIVDALLFADLLRQLVVGLLELADGLLEIGAETVERLAQPVVAAEHVAEAVALVQHEGHEIEGVCGVTKQNTRI